MVDVLNSALADAIDVAVAVAFVQMTGLQLLLPALSAAWRRGARIRLLTSTYLDVTEPQALRSICAQPAITLRVQSGATGFHAKAHLLVRQSGKVGWVGSSNWSHAGLRDNVEWNARIDDPAALEAAWAHFEGLWQRTDVVVPDEAFLAAYTKRWTEARIAREARTPLQQVAEQTAGYVPSPTPTAIQAEALQRLAAQRLDGVKRALIVAATGVGKTLLAAFDAHAVKAKTILFVAHRKDIITQAAKEFSRVFGGAFECDVLADGARSTGCDAVFVTIQTLYGQAGATLRARDWDYVVVDEFHHAEAERWKATLFALKAKFLLGLTATPERADGRNVMDLCEGNVAFEVRLPEAIRMGALLRFHYFGIADDDAVDYDSLPRNASDDQLATALNLPSRVDLILSQAVEKGFDGVKRVAIGFCAGVKHAEFMRDEFMKRGHIADVAYGGTKDDARKDLYRDLQSPSHPLQWLFVADLLNEGVDLPAINTVLFLRPTESSVVFLQQLGRGLRKHAGLEVLTVLDFVGRHRGAFQSLLALHDPNGVPTTGSLRVSRALHVPVTPPEGCEILLEDKTVEVLESVRKLARSRRQRIEEAYRVARDLLGRAPLPLDGRNVPDLSFKEVREAFGGWRELRIAMEDAEAWERDVVAGSPLDALLRLAERNAQLQRVDGYVALWVALDGDVDLAPAYAHFFEEHPAWHPEQKAHAHSRIVVELTTLLKQEKSVVLWEGATWVPTLRAALESPAVRASVRARLSAILAHDYQIRHGGVLRGPDALRRFARYARHEVVNHFGVQYDPAKHNPGVIKSVRYAGHYILLARIDTSGAKAEHQYVNRVVDRSHFAWSSQGRMGPTDKASSFLVNQKVTGSRVHLFVTPGHHQAFFYLGEVSVIAFEGSRPMQVTFALSEPMPDQVYQALSGAKLPPDAATSEAQK